VGFAAPCGVVALLTDFGLRDHYVGAMKGAILTARPHVRPVDVTHEVQPYAIEQGAFFLEQVWRRFPEGTVFCAVVDPGVGGARRALAVACAGRYGIGPDNGLFERALALGNPVVRALDVDRFAVPPLSATFHGRDLFAPAAARLAAGEPFETFGPAI
jgi:S-adenosyl-L-methionine hydrolase (adenosine-forming)